MQMPMTRLWKRELEEREMSVKSVRTIVPDDETLDIRNWLRDEFRRGDISREAFIEQVTALGYSWREVEYDATRIQTETDYDRTPDT
jgi:hypothetical protein